MVTGNISKLIRSFKIYPTVGVREVKGRKTYKHTSNCIYILMTHPEPHLLLLSRQYNKTAQIIFLKLHLGGISLIETFALLLITWEVLLTGYADIL